MSDSPEKPDQFIYQWLTLYSDTMRFFLTATRYYRGRLEAQLEAIRSDELFSELFDDAAIMSLDITKEVERFKTIEDRIQKEIDKSPGSWDYTLTLRHQDVRVLKALGLLYLTDLDSRRDRLGTNSTFSAIAIQALDSKISRFREILSTGVFKDATPWPLLIDQPEEVLEAEANVLHEVGPIGTRPSPRIISTIEIVDPQLRERCLDLITVFEEEEQSHRFDTVVSEATRVLEDRVRSSSGAGASQTGVELMTFAFGGEHPRLVISEEPAEQEAAHLMFRGVSGFVRNPFHHRLVEDLSRERLLQILGMVDYLLFLIQTAVPGVE